MGFEIPCLELFGVHFDGLLDAVGGVVDVQSSHLRLGRIFSVNRVEFLRDIVDENRVGILQLARARIALHRVRFLGHVLGILGQRISLVVQLSV